jgi:uncharacterized membrane protein SpoIIM required for sporulation
MLRARTSLCLFCHCGQNEALSMSRTLKGETMTQKTGWRRFRREWNIFFRTIHIISFSILFGGHYFAIPPAHLLLFLGLTIGSGIGLILTGCRFDRYWPIQIAGCSVILKLVILSLAFFFWEYRIPIYGVVIILGSVGSHVGSSVRHYSLWHGRILD